MAADTFAKFLAVLAEALDDHEASAADLAARVHLSRYHLSRVVAAAAGEAPVRLRRRLLLERAAYRLLGRTTILEVAVDAGYSSHEAFTRAFTRSFGTTPSQWRRAPAVPRLAGASDIHFQPPGSLALPSSTKETSMDLIVRMVEHHIWLVGEMITTARTLDDDVLEAPIELSVDGIDGSPTLRSLLARLVGQLEQWLAWMDMRHYDFGVEAGETLEHMGQRLERAGSLFLARVRELCEKAGLGETFVDVQCDPPAGVHLRRDDRSCPHLRRPSSDPRGRCAGQGGSGRPRGRGPDALAGAGLMTAHLHSVSVVHAVRPGAGRETAIDKRPVPGRVTVRTDGVVGDVQCDRRHHGGPDKAVYAYAVEDGRWWADQLGCHVPPGWFGENLTTIGLDITGALIGERWRLGGAVTGVVVEVTMPRTPCTNLSHRVGRQAFHREFARAGRVGAYLRVLEVGRIQAGSGVHVVHRPEHGVTVGDVAGGLDLAHAQALLSSGIGLAPVMGSIATRAVSRAAA